MGKLTCAKICYRKGSQKEQLQIYCLLSETLLLMERHFFVLQIMFLYMNKIEARQVSVSIIE